MLPVTVPVVETEAIAVLALLHTPPRVVSVRVDANPIHSFVIPPIGATTGNAFTVITIVAEQPVAGVV